MSCCINTWFDHWRFFSATLAAVLIFEMGCAQLKILTHCTIFYFPCKVAISIEPYYTLSLLTLLFHDINCIHEQNTQNLFFLLTKRPTYFDLRWVPLPLWFSNFYMTSWIPLSISCLAPKSHIWLTELHNVICLS